MCPICRIEWIKGHQNDDEEMNMEDRPLNWIKPTKRAPPLERGKATLYLGMNMVTSEMSEQIHFAAEAPAMMTHFQNHLRRTDETVREINWRTIGRAKKRLKLHKSGVNKNFR